MRQRPRQRKNEERSFMMNVVLLLCIVLLITHNDLI